MLLKLLWKNGKDVNGEQSCLNLETVKVELHENCNVILGTAHFIKTVEDIYEALVNAVPGIKFGIGFCEASGPCLVRSDGNDKELKTQI